VSAYILIEYRFLFMSHLLVMAYLVALLRSSIPAVRAGQRDIWFRPVEEVDLRDGGFEYVVRILSSGGRLHCPDVSV
jgi:hypothetical protein